MYAFSVKRPVERWIHRKIPSPNLLIHNRANLPGPGVDREFSPLISNLVRNADSDGPIPFLRNPHARANVITHPLHALSAALRREDVKAHFKPVGDAAGDFDGFVLGMIRRQESVLNGFGPVDREVAVELDHSVSGLDGVVRIDLDLVVILCTSGGQAKSMKNNQIESSSQQDSQLHKYRPM